MTQPTSVPRRAAAAVCCGGALRFALAATALRRCGFRRDIPRRGSDRARETRPVEAEAVSAEELAEVRARVRPRANDAPDAVAQHAVPVAVVAAEAGEVLAQVAERVAQVARGRIVGLEAREDLSPTEEVGRIVVEAGVLEDVAVGVGGTALPLGAREDAVHRARLAEEVELPVPAAALAQHLAGELRHRDADVGIEVADALLPVLVEGVDEIGQPPAAGLEESHSERRVPVED